MKTNLKRILCLLLVSVFALTALVACNKDKGNDTESSDTKGSNDVVDDTTPEETKPNDDDTLAEYDFDGAEYKILSRKSTRYEFDHKNDKGLDAVNNAIFLRNESVKTRFNVTIRIEETAGSWGSDFVDVYSKYMTGWSDVSLVAAHFPMQQIASTNGYCMDLTTLKTADGAFDMTKEWWSKQFYENCNIEGKFYVAVGDIGYTLYEYLQVVFFNEQLAEQYAVDASGTAVDLYDLVREDKWDWATFKTFVKNVNYVEADPIYGLTTNDHSVRSFATALEISYVDKDTSGSYVKYSFPTTASTATTTMVDDVVSFIRGGTANGVEYKSDNGTRASVGNKLFTENDVLFYTQTLGEVVSIAKDMDENSSYGVLPFPKADEYQLEYHTAIRDSVTGISVPKTIYDKEMVGVVTEALCMYSYQNIRPAYLDTVLGGRYMQSEDLKDMMNLIRNSFTLDFSCAYSACLGTPYSMLSGLTAATTDQSFSSYYEGKQSGFAKKLTDLYTFFNVSAT
ncbi:MAG: hypothetical protein IJ011_04645 [Clostridia bacterium]|nr:hypothetical protein [Clostridia bacterium]